LLTNSKQKEIFMTKIQPIVTKKTLASGKVVTVVIVPSRKYRPLPNNIEKYAKPRLALVRSATPIAHIAHPKWKKS
jgi:hypothetical protein